MKKLWAGGFKRELNPAVESFTASVDIDKRLAPYDIAGSIAHTKMLARCKIIKRAEADTILKGLRKIGSDLKKGKFTFEDACEDIHLNIEKALFKKIGSLAGKLHTARSRNDQVALDTRLYLRDETKELIRLIKILQRVLIKMAEANQTVIMPGFTHLQHAQPILFAHHILTYFYMLERDKSRFKENRVRTNVMPLGACALSGTTLPIDVSYTARLLKFPAVFPHSIDAVSDRDYMIEFTGNCSILMMHLSRLSEEIILWATEEFDFLEIDDSVLTGSSIMPQKKNPDIAELVRGKCGRIFGDHISLLTMMKGLPLSYNRDMQEDKPALFDAVETTKESLKVYPILLNNITINKKRLGEQAAASFTVSTDIAEYLVGKGVPFRRAHGIVGRLVLNCKNKKKDIAGLSLSEFRKFSPHFDTDIMEAVSAQKCIANKRSHGGTSPENVKKAIKAAKKTINA